MRREPETPMRFLMRRSTLIGAALEDLRQARKRLRTAGGCTSSIERIQAAIKSTEGAYRHARLKEDADDLATADGNDADDSTG